MTPMLYVSESGIGAGIDSYYEYLLKAYILLGDDTYLERFNKVKHTSLMFSSGCISFLLPRLPQLSSQC